MKGRWILAAALLLSGGSSADPKDFTAVSLIQLVASPEKYHGKKIQVTAFLRVEFEGNALYLHREDYEKGLTKNGIWLEFPLESPGNVDLMKLNNGYVIATGTFDAKNNGHFGLWSGALTRVTWLERWPPEHPKP
jgi:hypothetical protein